MGKPNATLQFEVDLYWENTAIQFDPINGYETNLTKFNASKYEG